MQKKTWWVGFVLAVMWVGISPHEGIAQGQKAEAFFRGATLRFIVPYGAGGSYDVWAKTLAPFLGKHTGAHVVVENMPGSGGFEAVDYLFSTVKPDGLTISVFGMPALVLAKMLGLKEAAKSDIENLNYLGRLEVNQRALFASKASGFRSITDMQKSSNVLFTSVGGANDSSVDAALVSEGFGLRSKILAGSKGSAEDLILLKEGKANAKCSSFSADYRGAVDRGDLNLILFLGRKGNPGYPQVPLALDAPGIRPGGKKFIELSSDLPEAGRMILTSPGVDAERLLFLEKALSASLNEPGFLDWTKKDRVTISYLPGKDCKELIARMMGLVPPGEREELKRIVFEKYY